MARTFDVLGWISVSVILMKILYQQLWGEHLAWDEVVPQSYQTRHAQLKAPLPLLCWKRMPRCYFRVDKPYTSVELHGFSDASDKADAAVVYIRSTYSNQPLLISLVSAKTKVAPIKPLSIPRLELCGAQLLAKLISSIHAALSLPLECITMWCDSIIVLAWLDGSSKHFKTFVGNRITSILESVPSDHWMHVPTHHNPADCASSGLMPADLVNFTLWWEGPHWLSLDPSQLPSQPSLGLVTVPEQRVITCNLHIPILPEITEGLYSCYHKTLKVTACCMRYVTNLVANHRHQTMVFAPTLTASELR